MPRRILKLLVVTSLVFTIGMHWIILQSVAWTGMVIVYSQTAPLRDALVKTFDGHHPCQLCKVVQEGKKAEQKLPQQKLTTKVDFFCNYDPLAVELPPPHATPLPQLAYFSTRCDSPPGPPPRLS